MTISFQKYHGTGNDFILIDNRPQFFSKNDTKLVSAMCDRHFGIGADGLILVEDDPEVDFNMVYYNADGREGSLCGNGARCTVAFAGKLGMVDHQTEFRASDGIHTAQVGDGTVRLYMNDVRSIREKDKYYFLNTGSPHHVQLVNDLDSFDVVKEGARLRYGLYGESGSNINFVEQDGPARYRVRTYERGVEDETYSCGTGVTAVAIAMHYAGKTDKTTIAISTRGGELEVGFNEVNKRYSNIYLEGPATRVFQGEYQWKS